MVKRLLPLCFAMLLFSVCLAEEAQIPPTKTVLKILNEQSINQAKIEIADGKKYGYSYYLGNTGPAMFHLITPYSILRYAYFQEKQLFITPHDAEIKDIYGTQDYIFIGIRKLISYTPFWVAPKNLVIRKNGTVYQSNGIKSLTLITWGLPENATYSFPIGLFDGEDLEIIAIDRNDDQIILKFKGSKMKDFQ